MIQPFRILDLPTELIKQICTDIGFDRSHLMALRLTCTFTCELSTQPFDRMCFTGISVLLTRRSLQALIGISNHPRIGPQIQLITLTPLRTFSEALTCLIPTHRCVYHEGVLGKAKASAKAVHQYLDRYHEEMELEQSGDTLRLLTEAFMSLRKYGRSLCLKVPDDEEIHIGAQGCFSGALAKVYEEEGVFKLYWKEVMSFLIKAVADSGCRVTRLSLENVTDADLIGEGKLWDDDLDEDVNRLSVSLTAFDVEVYCHDLHAVLKSIKQVISQAENLEILTFEPSGPDLYYDLAGFCHSVASSSLEAINLSSLCCSVSDLISFLSKQKSTLDNSWLSSTRLVGSWKSLVQWIMSNLTSLHTFGMYDILDDESQPLHNNERVTICDFQEVEDMPTALKKLLTQTRHHEARITDDTRSTD